MKKIEIFVGSDSAFEKIVPKSARNLSEMAAKLDDGNKKMDVFVNIPGQPEPKSNEKTVFGGIHYEKDYNRNALHCAGSSLCRMRKERRYIKSGN